MKIAILSCESSHAEAFSEIIKTKNYGSIETIWDQDEKIAKKKRYNGSKVLLSRVIR